MIGYRREWKLSERAALDMAEALADECFAKRTIGVEEARVLVAEIRAKIGGGKTGTGRGPEYAIADWIVRTAEEIIQDAAAGEEEAR